jgi:hypothetical protein
MPICVCFGHARFSGGTVTFGHATFSGGTVTFDEAEFSGGTVHFYGATFSGGTVDLTGLTGPRDYTGAWAAGGMISTAENLARFYRALLHGRLLAPA